MISPQAKINLSPSNGSKNDLIGSVQRALRILELLAHYPRGLSAKQVNQQLCINLSTCYHLLNTLMESHYVVKDPDTLLFRLSGKVGFTALGRATSTQIVQQLTPHVQALQETTLETAYLSFWDGNEITLSAIAESPRAVRVKPLTIGYNEANHASALGKAILAFLQETQRDHYLASHERLALTHNTLTAPDTLIPCLEMVRRQGYSLDIEECFLDICCIGAPIFDAAGCAAASIAVSLPATRYHIQKEAALANVKKAATAATRAMSILGYTGPAAATTNTP